MQLKVGHWLPFDAKQEIAIELPTRADVAWILAEGAYTYFRGRLTDLVFD